MQPICPFLALDEGGRTVVDGYDATHRCRSTGAAQPLDRARQTSMCLAAEHRECERYVAAMQAQLPVSWPAAAADTRLVQTRIVLSPSQSRGLLGTSGVAGRQRRWLLGGGLATIGIAAIASGVAGGLANAPTGSASPRADATGTAVASVTVPVGGIGSAAPQTPLPAATPTEAASAQPTASSTPTPSPTPEPQPVTYVVQPGDTLNGIAVHFGTTISALQQANGLGTSDVILAGQVLIIP